MCKLAGTYSQFVTTNVLSNNRSVECRSINKTLQMENVTVVGMYNPLWSDNFGNSNNGEFIIEVLQETSNVVLEERTVLQSVAITPGAILTTITPDNLFVLSNTKYEFALNLFNSLNSTDYIRIKFPLSWSLY